MARPASVPVTLQIGSITAEIGTVDIPLIAGPTTRDSTGRAFANFNVDHAEFGRALADLLRSTAHDLEKGATDGN